MIVDKLEDTLHGGFKGLYGEVVEEDCYKLRSLDFIPTIIFDIGANIGVFTRYARQLFPDAFIIAIEPDPENYTHLTKFTDHTNIMFINAAIGRGKMYHGTTAANGSGEVYMSSGLGYPDEMISTADNFEASNVRTIMPNQLLLLGRPWLYPGSKSLLKLDCEGAENAIWQHEESMDMLYQMNYICAELHFYAHVGGKIHDEVLEVTHKALKSFEETHDCSLEHIHFYARKRK